MKFFPKLLAVPPKLDYTAKALVCRQNRMTNSDSSGLRVVLLAAGQGKRMKSQVPKVLHPVLGKAILGRILDAVDALDAAHVHIVVGHESQQVCDYLQKNSPKTPYSTHLQEPQLGTGHALMQVVPDLKNFKGTLLVSVADAPLLSSASFSRLVQAHREKKAAFSLLTTIVDDARSYGRIVRDTKGNVTHIVEDKDASESEKQIREINPAIYCLEWPAVEPGLNSLRNDNKQKEYYLTDLLAWSVDKGLTVADALCDDWREVSGINSRLELAEANKLMRDQVVNRLALEFGVTIVDPLNTWISPEVTVGQETIILPGCYITGKVEIGSKCEIGPNTQITGPAKIGTASVVAHSVVSKTVIGDGCKIGPFTHLRENAHVSDFCRIGNFVEIKKSDIGLQTNVSHLSYIGDANLGQRVNIGAGTITANYNRLTGKKSKTVIGDDSSTGSNSVLIAPIVVGTQSMVAAGSVVNKDIPDGALGLARAKQRNQLDYVINKIEEIKLEQTQQMVKATAPTE